MPAGFSFEACAALPVVAVTTEQAFRVLAKVKAGDRVLVHAITGGVGLLALSYCNSVGAKVIGTAGSKTKRDYALAHGAEFVGDSRDAASFRDAVGQHLDGQKVDAVLNSFIGDFIPYSLDFLKDDGYFLELGKREIWTAEQVAERKPSVHYERIAVDVAMERDPVWFQSMLKEVAASVAAERYAPPPLEIFSLAHNERDGLAAFKHLQRAKHIGKVVVSIPSVLNSVEDCAESLPETDRTYLITGGFGGIGLTIAKWLTEEGAKNVVLVSRSGAPSGPMAASGLWKFLRDASAKGVVRLHQRACDIANAAATIDMLRELQSEVGPIDMVFHCAGVLDDRLVQEQTQESVTKVLVAKTQSAWTLHKALEKTGMAEAMRLMVCFSSFTARFGNFGQTNYGGANACLDAFAVWRDRKRPTISLQWGPWTEQGMAAQLAHQLASVGMHGISNEIGLAVLHSAIVQKINAAARPRDSSQFPTVSCVQAFDWSLFLDRYFETPANLAEISVHEDSGEVNKAARERLLAMAPEDRIEFVRAVVTDTARQVLGSSEMPSMDAPLQELGIDSLGAVEFRNSLQHRVGVKLPVTALFDYPTLGAINDFIFKEIDAMVAASSAAPAAPAIRAALRAENTERLAIVGMACRLPSYVTDPTSFWEMLISGRDCVVDTPPDRWNCEYLYDPNPDVRGKSYAKQAAYMMNIDLCDHKFFNISASEASSLDPQQRIMLEVAYEALSDAGETKTTLFGQNVGVYVGCCNQDWHFLEGTCNSEKVTAFTSSGGAGSLLSNRISYALGLRGPSFTVDTACSSSLVALDAAFWGTRGGACDGAVVGGVNCMVAPHLFVLFCKSRMLSPDCRCFTFDHRANGYARGEGAGAVYVLQASRAREKGLSVYGFVGGAAVNHNGRSASLTAPNGPAQQEVLLRSLQLAGVEPDAVSYIEAHGTGTALGDPIEVGAIKTVYGPTRAAPLVLGSLKTNIGHLEGASGIAGLIKVVLCLRHRAVPRNINFEKLNPLIDVANFQARFPVKEPAPLAADGVLVAGISSFGFGGANGHIILLSCEADPSFRSRADRVGDGDAPFGGRRVCFVFTGQGAQHAGMARRLFAEGSAGARAVYAACSQACRDEQLLGPGVTLEAVLDGDLSESINDTRYAQAATFVVELALVEELKTLGITPHAVLGHSLGEYVGAVVVGAMSLLDGFRIVCKRAEIMAATPAEDGVMYACRATQAQAQAFIDELGLRDAVAVAAVNGPRSVTLSGREPAVLMVLEKLATTGKKLSVSHAFHSPLVRATVAPIFAAFSDKRLTPPSSAGPVFVSTVTGQAAADATMLTDPAYWAEHITKPVLFLNAVAAAGVEQRCSVFIEIGAAPTLVKLIRACLPKSVAADVQTYTTMERGADELTALEALRALAFQVPKHRWEHVRVPWNYVGHPFVGEWMQPGGKPASRVAHAFKQDVLDYLADHVVSGMCLMPGAGLTEMVVVAATRHFSAASQADPLKTLSRWYATEFIEFNAPMVVPPREADGLRVELRADFDKNKLTLASAAFGDELLENVVASLGALMEEPPVAARCTPGEGLERLENLRSTFADAEEIDPALHYKALAELGLAYGPNFRTLLALRVTKSAALSELRSLCDETSYMEMAFRLEPGVLDGAFQTVAAVLAKAGVRTAMVPVKIEDLEVSHLAGGVHFHCHAVLIRRSARTAVVAIQIYDRFGLLVVKLGGVTLRAVEAGSVDFPRDLYWRTAWQPLPAAPAPPAPTGGDWLLVGKSGVAALDTAASVFAAAVRCTHRAAPLNDTEADILLREKTWQAIFLCTGLNAEADECEVLGDALMMYKAYGRRYQNETAEVKDTRLPKLVVLTRGAIHAPEFVGREATRSLHAGLLGMARSAWLEIDNILTHTPPFACADIADVSVASLESFASAFFEHADEAEWVEHAGQWFTSRMIPLPLPAQDRGPCSISIGEPRQYPVDQLSLKPDFRPEVVPHNDATQTVRILAFEIGPGDAAALKQDDSDEERWAVHKTAWVGVGADAGNAGRLLKGISDGVWRTFAVLDSADCQVCDEKETRRWTAKRPPVLVGSVSELCAGFARDSLAVWRTPLSARPLWENFDGAYLVTGGWGGLGLTVARWLIQEGARHLYLVSRRGDASAAVKQTDNYSFVIKAQDAGVRVVGVAADASRREDVRNALRRVKADGCKLRGIFHAAGVLQDFPMSNQGRNHIDTTFMPKAAAARWLDAELAEQGLDAELEHFVLFSSITALIGNYSQVNYGAANAVLDALAAERRQRGAAALSIQWGPWTEQGMAADMAQLIEKVGMKGISNDVGLRVMHALLYESLHSARGAEVDVVGIQGFQFKRFLHRFTSTPKFYAAIPPALLNAGGDAGSAVDIKQLSHEELVGLLADVAQQVSGISDRPTAETAMIEMGFDSLGAVEFRNNVLDLTGIRLAQTLAFENPTLGALADYIFENAGVTAATKSGAVDLSRYDKPTEEWVLATFSASDRGLLYIERFAEHYPRQTDLIGVEDVDAALAEVLHVDDEGDRSLLSIAWNALQDEALGAAGAHAAAVTAVKTTSAKVPHPLEDLTTLKEELAADGALHFDVSRLKPPTPISRVKHVLLTGVTGFVGRCQLATLMHSPTHPDLRVYCIVRARSSEHAIERIRLALQEAVIWEDRFVERIVPLCGDFTLPDLGLGEEKFAQLAEKIDLVFHTGGDVNLLCNYSKVRSTNTLSVRGIIRFCTTAKLKSLNFTSTLGQYPDLFGFFTREFEDRYLHEDTGPRLDEMETFFPPQRQGYPWSKWVAEMVIREARKMGLPAHIYRLPNTYCGYRTGYTNRTDYATALMISTIQEGVFPISSAFAVLTPVDIIADMVVEGGLLDKPETERFWVYNLIDTSLVYMHDMERWARQAGIRYKGVPLDDFLDRVKKRGPSSPVYRFVPLMQYWRSYWFDQKPRKTPWPIRTQNIFDDLPHQAWPPMEAVFRASFLFCAARNYFAADSLAISLEPDDVIAAAEYTTNGLSDLGEDGEFYLEPVMRPLSSEMALSEMSFLGKLSLFRACKQYLVNLLVMQEREQRYPEIRRQQIRAPLIITGLNRSGTTFLQNLLDCDPNNRGVLYMEQAAPYGEAGEFDLHDLPDDYDLRADPRASYAQSMLDEQFSAAASGQRETWMLIHAQDALRPEEEFMIMEHCGRSYSICVEFDVKQYREWLLADHCREMKAAYGFHKRFLQHLQWQRRGGSRFLLKMPFHLWALDALFAQYPDAQIIMTHRDPVEVMGSWCSLVKHGRERTTTNVDAAEVGPTELAAMSSMIRAGLDFRAQSPERANQFADVAFRELIRDPIATVKSIYAQFGLPLSTDAENNMREFIVRDRDARRVNKKHDYSLEEAGLTVDQVRAAFDFYYETPHMAKNS